MEETQNPTLNITPPFLPLAKGRLGGVNFGFI
jgi:hypothetical protein